jgi:hypothetical protein
LKNHNKVTTPSLDLSEFTAPTRELAQSLAACIVGDDELQSRIVPVLKAHDRQIRVDRTTILESIVLDALLAGCHGAKVVALSITGLTASVNTVLAGRGDSQGVSPEIVGWKLRALGLRTEFIAGGRKGLALLDETRARIHALAAAYGVRTVQLGIIDGLCPQCTELVNRSAEAGPAEAMNE